MERGPAMAKQPIYDSSKWTGGYFKAPIKFGRRPRNYTILSAEASHQLLKQVRDAVLSKGGEGGTYEDAGEFSIDYWMRTIKALREVKKKKRSEIAQGKGLVRIGEVLIGKKPSFKYKGRKIPYPDYLFDVTQIFDDGGYFYGKKDPYNMFSDLLAGYKHGYAEDYGLYYRTNYSDEYRFGYWVGYDDSPGPKVRSTGRQIGGEMALVGMLGIIAVAILSLLSIFVIVTLLSS